MPCFIDRDLRSLRAIESTRESEKGIFYIVTPCTNLVRLLASSGHPSHHKTVSVRRGATGSRSDTRLVQKADAKPHVHLHLFFLKLASGPILHDNIRRILWSAWK